MTRIGVYDDNGECIDMDNVPQHFGPLLSKLISTTEDLQAYRAKAHGDVSPSDVTQFRNWCPLKANMNAHLFYYSYYKNIWSMNRGTFLHKDLLHDNPYSEMRLVYQTASGLFVTAQIDGYDPSQTALLELKSTGYLPKEIKDDHLMQGLLCEFLMREGKKSWNDSVPLQLVWAFGKPPGLFVNKIIYPYIGFNDYNFKVHKIDNPLTKEEVDTIFQETYIAKTCEEGSEEFQRYNCGGPKFEKACQYCDFARYCKTGRDNLRKLTPYALSKVGLPSTLKGDKVILSWKEVLDQPEEK